VVAGGSVSPSVAQGADTLQGARGRFRN